MANSTQNLNKFDLEPELKGTTQTRIGTWKHHLLITLGAVMLFAGIDQFKDHQTQKNSKSKTEQSPSTSDSLVEKYGFKIDKEKSSGIMPSLTMDLEFHHNEGDMVINKYEIVFKQNLEGENMVNQYTATVDDGSVFTKDIEYKANDIKTLADQVKNAILSKNPGLQESVLSKVDEKFSAVCTVINHENYINGLGIAEY